MVVQFPSAGYPTTRMRRNRRDAWTRRLAAENRLSVDDLIWPIFVRAGEDLKESVDSMPGQFRHSPDRIVEPVQAAYERGIPAVAIFPLVEPGLKTPDGAEAVNPNNALCDAVRRIKDKVPDIGVICDAALDPFTSHGHDGVIQDGYVANDQTVEILCQQSIVQARAGCDVIAPSDMMDGRIGAIRKALDAEGADMVMVKPGLPYLDIIRRVKDTFGAPTVAYNVSGEYSMLKAAAIQGWLEYDRAMMEALMSFKRAGADAILTYAAMEAAELLEG